MVWTDHRVSELTRLWGEGMSTGEIGKNLGVSKNSVVGKAHRLKLAARPSPIKRSANPVKKAKVVTKIAPVTSSEGKPRTVVELSAQSCRWPFGDPKEKGFHFCGSPSAPGRPYCAEHAAIAYVPAKKKNVNAA